MARSCSIAILAACKSVFAAGRTAMVEAPPLLVATELEAELEAGLEAELEAELEAGVLMSRSRSDNKI